MLIYSLCGAKIIKSVILFESFQRDYSTAPLKGIDGQSNASKTMNTHIHVLEAYTTLYQVWHLPSDYSLMWG